MAIKNEKLGNIPNVNSIGNMQKDAIVPKKNYEDDRLEEQLKWHSEKARTNKFRYRLCQIIIMIISAAIPLINLINNLDLQTRIISSILGATIAVITGFTQLEKYQENWIVYRTTQELLKKEKYYFRNGAGEYANLDEEAKRKLLVVRIESLISSETNKYFIIHQPQKTETEVKK